MEGLRIGSLCSGYGGLDLAVMDALGGHVAWHAQYDPADKKQWAAKILEHRWPGIPNHGDITRADWFEAEPVDIITAGFPCQPISHAGLQKGTADDRWIWPAVAQCVRLLRPRLVVLENVAALVVRGLSDIVTDLARIGYVGTWTCLRASDVGAPHQRNRVFILAWPADAHGARRQGPRLPGRPAGDGGPASDSDSLGQERHRAGGQPAQRHPACADRAATDPPGLGSGEPSDETLTVAGSRQARTVPGGRGVLAAADADGKRRRTDEPDDGPRQPDTAWGPYGPAIARWEHILGREAPPAVDARGRLAPIFVEWMMGAPAGWVTDVYGLPRSAQLKALGNGVVRQQGAEGVRRLVARMPR